MDYLNFLKLNVIDSRTNIYESQSKILDNVNKLNDIIEIGAVKMVGDRIVDTYSKFVKPSRPVPKKIEELTLYMIQIQEQNEAMQKTNDALLKRIEVLESK